MGPCAQCGTFVPHGRAFCPKCGAPASTVIPPPQMSAPKQRSRRRSATIAGGTAIVLLVAGLVIGIILGTSGGASQQRGLVQVRTACNDLTVAANYDNRDGTSTLSDADYAIDQAAIAADAAEAANSRWQTFDTQIRMTRVGLEDTPTAATTSAEIGAIKSCIAFLQSQIGPTTTR